MRIDRCLFLLAGLGALACGRLPDLPNAEVERVPASLEFNGLTLAVGFEGAGTTVEPTSILAGTAVQATFTVRAQDELPLAGALIQFGVKADRWARVLDFPLGASCTTDDQGVCSTVLRSEGRSGPVQFEARVAGLESQWIDLAVIPDQMQAQVSVEIEGLGSFDWETGQDLDPLNNEATRLVLDRNQPAGTALQVRLQDAFGNALTGLTVGMVVLVEETQVGMPDAGPMDAGTSDAALGLDASPTDLGLGDGDPARGGAMVGLPDS